MRKFFNWQVNFALILIVCSLLVYGLHYYMFRDFHHIMFYLISDIAFLFIDVLIVMLILHRLLAFREKQPLSRKLNMVIGTFFSEVGIELVKMFAILDKDLPVLSQKLLVSKDWADKDFALARKFVEEQEIAIEGVRADIPLIKRFLLEKRPFLLGLLENPNLLEHESFTDLLWAVFHLTDELAHRKEVTGLSEADFKHLSGDINRAYKLIIVHWLSYMQHLKEAYPYLFSLAVRTNPFDKNAIVEIK